MIGEFSRYEQKTLTFANASNASNWDSGAIVPCSFVPKLVIFSGGSSENEHVISGVFALNINNAGINMGALKGLTGSGSSTQYVYSVNGNASMQRFYYDSNDGVFYICRAAATVYWHPEDTYIFEIYG